jgi:hypothetical protein
MPDTARSLALLAFGWLAGLGCESATDPPAVGALGVYVATTGPEADPDGYQVRVDGTLVRGLSREDSTLYQGLEPGTHAVELVDLAANCAVHGGGLRSATVTGGDIATVRFEVVCTATAVLRVVTRSDGAPADPDGYRLVVSGRGTRAIGANEAITMMGLTQGPLGLELTDLAATCAVAGGNRRMVTLVGGDTAEVDFTIHCAQPPPGYGTIDVSVSTTVVNAPVPNGYRITLDNTTSQSVAANGTVEFEHLSTGLHSVGLSGAPSWCAVGGFFPGPNPQQVWVMADSVSRVAFAVLCLG